MGTSGRVGWGQRLLRGDSDALVTVALCAAGGFVALYLFAVWTAPGQWLDAHGFGQSHRVLPGWAASPLSTLVRVVIPIALALLTLVLGVLAVKRRSWTLLLVAAIVVAVSVPLSWWLRVRALPVPRSGMRIYEPNTYPSAHMAAVAALTVAVLLLWPRRPDRAVVVMGVLLVGLACVGNVVGQAHVPSDPIGSVLLVAAVATSVLAVANVGSARTGPAPRGEVADRRDPAG